MAALFLILLPLAAIFLVIYLLTTWKFDYWKKRKVPYLKPLPFFGNYKDYICLQKTSGEVAQDICRQFPNEPYIGTYYGTEPALLVQDPELIKLITAKDFSYFSGREISNYADREIITRNMFFTYGDKWKVARQNISPLFTVSKLKSMFPLIQDCVRKFDDMLEYETGVSKELDVRFVIARFTMDCVVSIAFGIEANAMGKNVGHQNVFRKMGDLIFEISNTRGIFLYVRQMWPAFFYGLGFTVFPKAITDFFHNLLTDVFISRGYKPSNRNDFVDLILNLKNNVELTSESILQSTKGQKVTLKVDDEFLVAQCVLFFAAGFETSATTTSVVLYQLAKDQEAQKRAREEVDEYLRKNAGKIEYDCITELPYLEACVSETLRLHPVLGLLSREVLEPYTLPSGVKLEKGLRVHIPVYHLHKHPTYFPDPEVFKPERFLPENKDNITPYTYLPFGEGQRICLGMRIAKMQMYPGLITVLRKYHIQLAEGMPTQTKFEPRAIVTQTQGPIRLTFTPRK